ncbi:uncharacterized protein METZ01_LOCUS10301 [marine metagenome]|uniref:Uncharacterized protein n=1 Tax=marine metagenome TaxID=408172 RepID=A0A381NSF5_9ZZZZ
MVLGFAIVPVVHDTVPTIYHPE